MDKDKDFPFVSACDCAVGALERIETRFSRAEDESAGLCHSLLRGPLGRLRPGAVTLVAGGPGAGKTAFSVSVLRDLLWQKVSAAVFTPGTVPGEFMDRLLAAYSGVSYKGISTGVMDRENWPGLTRATSSIAEAPLWICGRAELTAATIRSDALELAARLEAEKKKLDLVVIDSAESLGVGAVSDFSALAAKTGAAVLYALATEAGKTSLSKAELRRLGVEEQDLGVALFLHSLVKSGQHMEARAKAVIGGRGKSGKLTGFSDSCCFMAQQPIKPAEDFFGGE